MTNLLQNRLQQSTSSYLQSAADQPVHWQEWDDNIFKLAQELDRPILLDIGAVWCHWCHVMDRESYENTEIANIINNHFIPVKVDRDERPDVDRRYQTFVQALNGSGGWPLTCFLTHESKLFYGGTYFPPDDRRNLHGMKTILQTLSEAWQNEKEKIISESDAMLKSVIDFELNKYDSASPNEQNISVIIKDISASFDPVYGGFGDRMKFPSNSALEFLMIVSNGGTNKVIMQIINTTLEKMALGGIHDHIGGGFHRYSVDPYWHVPHFEKMTNDNAEFLQTYLLAAKLTGDPLYAEIARSIISWYQNDMTDLVNGGFYASQDADISLDDDGSFFTWSIEEIAKILSSEEAAFFNKYYGILESPKDIHEYPEQNVIYSVMSLDTTVEQLDLTLQEGKVLLQSSCEKLKEARLKRTAPFIDKTIYSDLNGMMISAFIAAYNYFGDPWLLEHAKKSADYILKNICSDGTGFLHTSSLVAPVTHRLLSDQVCMATALLDLFGATGDAEYFSIAVETADRIIKLYEDNERGGFYDIEQNKSSIEIMKILHKPAEDIPVKSSNAIAISLMQSLYYLTGNSKYDEVSQRALSAFAGSLEKKGTYIGGLGIAIHNAFYPPKVLIMIGTIRSSHDEFDDIIRSSQSEIKTYFIDPSLTEISLLPSLIRDKIKASSFKSTAFLCTGRECQSPVTSGKELRDHLQQ